MRLSDLQEKDVINIEDGRKVGVIIDVDLDRDGSMKHIIVEKKRWFFFFHQNEVEIEWNQIKKIGEDVILVHLSSSEI